MSAPHAEQIISGYLARLEQALADVPPARRAELVEDVRRHIAEARSAQAEETDATILNILDKLGEPADIAAEARGGARPAPLATPVGVLEIAAIVALVLVWPAGIALVWLSSAWSQRDKLIATLLFPAAVVGLGSVGMVGGFFTHFYILAIVLVLSPVVWSIGAIFLAVRLYQARQSGGTSPAPSPTVGTTNGFAAVLFTLTFWPVGIVLLWRSTAWSVGDKLIGTLLPPGGYLGAAIIIRLLGPALGDGSSCAVSTDATGTVTNTCTTSGPPEWLPPILVILMLALLVLPVFTAAYLTVRLRVARTVKPVVSV